MAETCLGPAACAGALASAQALEGIRVKREPRRLRVIASIEDPALIGRILQHLEQHSPSPATTAAPPHARGPPPRVLDLS